MSHGAYQERKDETVHSRREFGETAPYQRRTVGVLRPERGGQGTAARSPRRRSAPCRRLHQVAGIQPLREEQEGNFRSRVPNPKT